MDRLLNVSLIAAMAAVATGPALAASPTCGDQTATVYFEDGSSALTREAKSNLKLLRATANDCQVRELRVVGLAGDPGDAAANMALSQARASMVVKELQHHGFKPIVVVVTAKGDVDDTTSKGLERPMHRRVDVALHLTTKPGR